MNKRWMTWSVLGALATAGLGFAGARALATGAPQLSPLTYGGVLTDKDGKAYPSVQEVVLKFYDKVDATAAKCVAPAALAEAGTGRFSVVLPGECAQAVRDSPDLWSEATVGGGKTVLPRVHVGAVPYALEADSAKVAAGATGGLKAAVDGVVADVAALKKAPAGGAPKVVDGAGVVLGTLTEVNEAYLYFVTNKGYYVIVDPVANVANKKLLYFTSPDCSGQAYREVGQPTTSIGAVLYRAKDAGGSAFEADWFVDTVQPGGGTKSVFLTAKSVLSNGKCQAMGGLAMHMFALTQLTSAQAGLPDKITLPMKIAP